MNKATITRTELAARIILLKGSFAEQLARFQKTKTSPNGFTKKQIEDMQAGFADGLRGMVNDLREIGLLEITDPVAEPKTAVPA
jgi:hypothetical protein